MLIVRVQSFGVSGLFLQLNKYGTLFTVIVVIFQVVIRRLPPSLTEDQLKEEIGDLPEHDFFYFVGSDMR